MRTRLVDCAACRRTRASASRPTSCVWNHAAQDTRHPGQELATLAKDPGFFPEQRGHAIVLSCGTGSDAALLLQHFDTVACVELCAEAVERAVPRMWRAASLAGA